MTTCVRCTRKLDTVAKAARSEVCTTCASQSGELSPVGLLPLTEFRTHGDYLDRVHSRLVSAA